MAIVRRVPRPRPAGTAQRALVQELAFPMVEKGVERLTEALQSVEDTQQTFAKLFKDLSQVLRDTKAELVALEKQKAALEQEKKNLENERDAIESHKELLELEKQKLTGDKDALEREKAQLKADRDYKAEKLGEAEKQQAQLLEEYATLKADLQKLTKIADEKDKDKTSFEKIKTTLRIYVTLLDKIYAAMPHFRILYLLHGQKEEIHRDTIKDATGISGAMVMRSLHELRKAHLVDYDDETGKARLIERFF